ncbi:MAG: undecaprenyl-diphosphate phosphatase [Oscillospiraceae bacterium]|nr:undecaprenyl-diphosphate phosphatase [Oscillospiraceae bacterium]
MFFIEILKAIFLGIVEGITEWLPISSTGHQILVEQFLNLKSIDPNGTFIEMFRVVNQLGAILAVVVLYFKKLNPFSSLKNEEQKKDTWQLWLKVLVACIPAGVIGALFDDWLDAHLYSPLTVAIMLIVYGVLFIVVERFNKKRSPKVKSLASLTYTTALLIGFAQMLSLIPGTSRSGATILGAILIGTSRYVAAEFTFFLAIPAMAGASLFKVLKFITHGSSINLQQFVFLLVGTIVAFVVSIFVIKFLMSYIKKHDFTAFGWYRIAVGAMVLILFVAVPSYFA